MKQVKNTVLNLIEGANKHTSCDYQLRKGEVWLGNVCVNKEGVVCIPKEYSKLKTVRLGEQAYCINGLPLCRNHHLPLIISKSEEPDYDEIYMDRMRAVAR